jgi:hypothetical protein
MHPKLAYVTTPPLELSRQKWDLSAKAMRSILPGLAAVFVIDTLLELRKTVDVQNRLVYSGQNCTGQFRCRNPVYTGWRFFESHRASRERLLGRLRHNADPEEAAGRLSNGPLSLDDGWFSRPFGNSN